MGPRFLLRIASVAVVLGAAASALAASGAGERVLSVRWENDVLSGTDRFYTNGVSVSLARSGPSRLDRLADRLPWAEGRRTVGWEIGQIMVTPSDTERRVPDPTDRPYAGLLYGAVSLHSERDGRYDGLKLIAGVVGPWSLAEQTQKLIHSWVGSPQPHGWDAQLRNEPILNLVYEHRRKYRVLERSHGVEGEVLPLANVMLGNALTQGQIGAQLRFGHGIPDDFGTTLMRGMVHLPPARPPADAVATGRWGIWGYGGAGASLVAHNITLDGNTWRDGPHVERRWLVPAAEVGIGVVRGRWQAALSYVFWGKEFRGQTGTTEFGAFTVTYRFRARGTTTAAQGSRDGVRSRPRSGPYPGVPIRMNPDQ